MSPPPDFIRQWVDAVSRQAGLGEASEEMVQRVVHRLERGAESYGADNYLRAPLDWLIDNMAEEGDDLVGWGATIVDRLFHEIKAENIDPDRVGRAQAYIGQAAAHGLLAWLAMDFAREELFG